MQQLLRAPGSFAYNDRRRKERSGFGPCRKGIGVAENSFWWMLIYKIPAEPSSARVAVWRQLKAHGAVALQQSVWVLPIEPAYHAFFTELRQTIEAAAGSAYVLRVEDPDGPAIIERFWADRNTEYQEFMDRYRAFQSEIAREQEAHKYTFAELTEIEEDFSKMQQWLAKIQARDYYTAPRQAEALTALAHAEATLHAFAQAVYHAEGLQETPGDGTGNGLS